MVQEEVEEEINVEIDVIAEAEHEAVSKLRKRHDRIEKSAVDSGVSETRLKQIKDKHEKERNELNKSIEDNLEAQSRYTKMSHEEVETKEETILDEAMGTIANQKKAAKFKDSDVNRMIRDEKARKAAEDKKEKQSEKKEKVEEALGKSASASDFIHDFVHSKNPKFAGKSKKQRIQQALAAYYQKNEEERSPEFDHAIMEDEMPKPTSPGEAERMAQRYYNMSKTVGDPQSKKHYKYISNKMYALAKQLRKRAVMGEAAVDDTQKASTQITVHDSHEDAKKEALRKSKTYNDIFKVLKDPVTNTYVVTHKDNVDPTGAKPTVGMSHPFDIYTKGNNESFELFADSMINEEITLADGTVANLDGDLTVKLMRLYNGLNENNQDELVYSLHDDIDSLANILDLVNSVE